MSFTDTFFNDIRAKANIDFIEAGGTIKIVPVNPAGNRNYSLPDAGGNDTFVFQAMTQPMSNKTITSFTLGGNLAAGGFLITGYGTPVNPTDVASKAYADSDWLHPACSLATAAALPSNTYSAGVLTATANAALTVDGVAVTTGMRILVNNEVTASHNGIYTVTNTGSGSAAYVLTRATDFSTTALIDVPTFVLIGQGSTNAGSLWYWSNITAVLDTTAITFTEWSTSTTFPLALNKGGTNANLSAAAGGVIYSGASAFAVNTPQGSLAGVPLLSGTGGIGAPTFGALNLAGGSSIVTGNLPTGNGGTGSNVPATGLANLGGQARQRNVVAKTAAYIMVATDDIILVSNSGASYNITLVTPGSGTSGLDQTVTKTDNNNNPIVLLPPSGTISGAASITIDNQGDSYTFFNDQTNFWLR